MAYKLFGIPNCDTVKKARIWLSEKDIEVDFHNYKKQGIEKEQIELWLEQTPLNIVLNKASSTYRKLSEDQKKQTKDKEKAIALLVENPSMIKRPVLMKDNEVIAVGFKPDQYSLLF